MAHSQSDRDKILSFSRKVLEESLKDPSLRNKQDWIEDLAGAMTLEDNTFYSLFVTLRKNGQLRGCVGTLSPESNLLLTAAWTALRSAYHDPRFPSITEQEMKDTELEISILSPMNKVASPDEIIPKLHGVYVRNGQKSGIFLPQVWEQITGRNEFLTELLVSKAGLPPSALKDGATEFFVFTVEILDEGGH